MPLKVLIVILLLLFLLLCLPVGVDAAYAGGSFSAGVRVGPKVFWVFPTKRGRAHKRGKKADTKSNGKPEPEGKKKRLDLDVTWDEVKAALHLVARSVKQLRFRLHRLDLRFVSGGPDPYQTAMAYGYANAAANALGLYRLKQADVSLSADFTAEAPEFEGDVSVTIRVYYLCKFGVLMATGGLRLFLRRRKRLKQERTTAALIAGKEG